MSVVMEEFKPSVSTLEEVKKLQDLVRKLEIQNLHLRNKQISSRRRSNSPVKEHRSPSNSSRSVKKTNDDTLNLDSSTYIENSHSSLNDEYFDHLEIIRVSDLEMSDDESWLYTSPRSRANERRESPYKWLRKDVDDPENKPLQLAKKALLTKLNELEILSPANKMNYHFANNSVSKLQRSEGYYKPLKSAQSCDLGPIDTRTFTRSKKKQALDFLEKLDLATNERSMEKIHSEALNRRGSDMSSDSMSTCHVLEDANDVQEVARMQKESLRMGSPMGMPKRGSTNSPSRKISSSRGSVSDQEISETSVFSTQSTEDIEHDLFESDSYPVEPLPYSNHSSSSESPYGSNGSLHNSGNGSMKLSRRSLPNLSCDSKPSRQSKSRLNREKRVLHSSPVRAQSRERKYETSIQISQKNYKREFITPSRPRQPSNPVPQRGNSNRMFTPHSKPNTSVPRSAGSDLRHQSKSALPRPFRANSATPSNVRSGIPMPSMLNKKRVEDTWSDGCF